MVAHSPTNGTSCGLLTTATRDDLAGRYTLLTRAREAGSLEPFEA